MKKRITFSLVLMLIIGIFITSVLFLNIFYNMSMDNQRNDVIEIADTVVHVIDENSNENIEKIVGKFNNENTHLNLFYISKDGKIIYPKNYNGDVVDENVINDVLNKKKNITKFEGEIGENFFIEGREIEKGFLVMSKLTESPFKSISVIVPGILTLLGIGYFIALFISERTINDFVMNIEEQARDLKDPNIEIDNKYKELYPFIRIIRDQNEDIREHIEEIKSQNETIDAIISNMTEGLILLDKDMNILSINNGAINLGDINFNDRDLIGVDIRGLFRSEEMNDHLDEVSKNPIKSYNFDLKTNNKIINVLINPVINNTELEGFVMIMVDETRQRMLELQRSEFSANVSHELKTPLTSINGYAEMMKSGFVKDEDVKRFGGIIYDEGQNLLNMIDDIIKISKLDESYDQLELEEVNISLLIENIISTLRRKIKEKSIDIDININTDKTYKYNKQLLKELLLNLIDNGIKYNKTGGALSIKVEEVEDELEFIISDTGIGIPKEEQKRIFERFYTVDKSHNKKDSSGLGLSIVKHILRLMNGEIKLESKPNQGTKFTIKLPIYE